LRRAAEEREDQRSFESALREDGISLIAELKRASPSAGLIRDDFDIPFLLNQYEGGGARALSILTDAPYFQGALGYLSEARKITSLPALRKDFLIDEYQIAEAGAAGADAFLLIVAILSTQQLADYIVLGRDLGMDALVEIHDRRELDRAVEAGANIIGINNRDLRSFHVSLDTSVELGEALPEECVRVSESGIYTRDDVEMLEGAGFDAVLVGTSLMRKPEPSRLIRTLLGHDG
ncbi:MAG: indole-3-glycerol phosphate synthase TrpC, partial [Gemmatimonadetes bacterium]|nr:indole-3-glycerol phosphate synthase TrpC [Gemmatimonadota bacterium]